MVRCNPLVQANEVLRPGVDTRLFPQLACGGLQQRFVLFEMSGWLVPQRLTVDALFHNQEFTLRVNHAGEIAVLADHVRPHVAVITTIAPAHIENLGTIEAIAEAKAEIFSGLEPGGTAVIPADVPEFTHLLAAAKRSGAKVLSFGRSEKNSSPHTLGRSGPGC